MILIGLHHKLTYSSFLLPKMLAECATIPPLLSSSSTQRFHSWISVELVHPKSKLYLVIKMTVSSGNTILLILTEHPTCSVSLTPILCSVMLKLTAVGFVRRLPFSTLWTTVYHKPPYLRGGVSLGWLRTLFKLLEKGITTLKRPNEWVIQKLKRDTNSSELWLLLSFGSENNFLGKLEKASVLEFWKLWDCWTRIRPFPSLINGSDIVLKWQWEGRIVKYLLQIPLTRTRRCIPPSFSSTPYNCDLEDLLCNE